MAQINPVRRLSLSLSSQKAGQKQKGQILAVSAQLMALVSALRSLSSVALSSARVSPVYHPFLTPLRQGDISTLQNRGHLYFALTRFQRTKNCPIILSEDWGQEHIKGLKMPKMAEQAKGRREALKSYLGSISVSVFVTA